MGSYPTRSSIRALHASESSRTSASLALGTPTSSAAKESMREFARNGAGRLKNRMLLLPPIMAGSRSASVSACGLLAPSPFWSFGLLLTHCNGFAGWDCRP